MLHLKTDEIDTPEKRGKYKISIVGCGQNGIGYTLAFAEAGFKVTCTDADHSVIKQLSRGNTQLDSRQAEARLKSMLRKEHVKVTSDLKAAVADSNVTVITVGAKIDSTKVSDNSEIAGTCKQVGKAISKGTLVVYVGLAGVGFVEGIVKETLENTSGFKTGEDFGLAYNPVFNSICLHEKETYIDEVTIAANDKYSLNSASLVFGTIAKSVKITSEFKMAEAAVLFSAAKRDTETALQNELAMFCEKTGLDYLETMKLTQDYTCPSSGGPTISEGSNREQVYLLLENAENINTQLRLPKLARQINESMIKYALNLTQDSLRTGSKTLRRARIAVLGAAEPSTAGGSFVELLEAKGAKVSRYDPCSSTRMQSERNSLKKTLNDSVEGADCLVILSEQEQFRRLNLKKLHALMRMPASLVDLAGVLDPIKVAKSGFIYRGLGRGRKK